MPFSKDQIEALNAPLSRSFVKTRQNFSYLEAWHVIAEANRIFGFDRWCSETAETRCVVERERLVGKQATPGWSVTYIARVRISVLDTITREGCGSGHGIDIDLGQAHESAIKEAETDARKRALMTFGNQFGLALYDKEQTNVADEPTARELYLLTCEATIEQATNPEQLVAWWRAEHNARRDLLNPADIIRLKGLVTAKLPPRNEEKVA